MRLNLSVAEAHFFTYTLAIISLIGAVANIVVIVAILSQAKLRRSTINALLVNMVGLTRSC